MITPNSLYPGARVALVAPASAVPEDRLSPAVEAVKALSLEPVVYPSCYFDNRHGYFAADDGQRAKDLQDAFADPSIQGIWCIRGGYGAGRLLPLLNWRDIARHPKLFCGYSDVTALHIALNQCCRLVTYHTPMPSTELYQPVDDFTTTYLRRALFGALTGPLPLGQGVAALAPGRASGPLCGGNLSLICDSLGTPWEIDTRGKVLFLEDIGEKTYRVAAMLTQLPLDQFYEELILRTGYAAMLETKNTVEDRTRLENVRELLTSINGYLENAGEEPSLAGFLDEIALYTDLDNHDPDQDCVVMMTMHSAKGLEFPVVFVVGAEEGIFPGIRAIGEQDEMEEERRLCYVAMTRAKERLYLTCAGQRMLFGRTSSNRPSRFLDEIPPEHLERSGRSFLDDGWGGMPSRTSGYGGYGTRAAQESRSPYDQRPQYAGSQPSYGGTL